MPGKDIICILCPRGCRIKIDYNVDNSSVSNITGYGCQKGLDYGLEELHNPSRIITTTVRVKNGELPLLPVKTERGIPKDLIFPVMKEISNIEVEAPVRIGQIIKRNLLNTGIDLIAGRDILKYNGDEFPDKKKKGAEAPVIE
ncbi:MAG: DUF1667 domain-containing protein [Halanaerobiaceae bacterium]|nr:DUF1667 domain-containing protein [Halanaerobiaceae bacterium]